jgi:AcrR family transcriptional regulator
MRKGHGPDVSYAAFSRMLKDRMADLFLEILDANAGRIKVKNKAAAARDLEKLFAVAISLSIEKGFAALTLADVAEVSGLAEDAVNNLLGNKEDFRGWVLRYGSSFTAKTIMSEVEAADTPREQLAAAVRTHLYLSETLRDWFYFAYTEAKNLSPEEKLQAMANEKLTETLFIGILKKGQEQGEFWLRDLSLTAAVIKAMLQDWYLKRWKYRGQGVSVEQYSEFVIDFVTDAIME